MYVGNPIRQIINTVMQNINRTSFMHECSWFAILQKISRCAAPTQPILLFNLQIFWCAAPI
jgi:hypothetical protein